MKLGVKVSKTQYETKKKRVEATNTCISSGKTDSSTKTP